MTIDEAIKHAEEVAEEHERHLKVYENMDEDRPLFRREEENECKDCAEEHRQLARWLKELKQLREQEPCEDAVSRANLLKTFEDRFIELQKAHRTDTQSGVNWCINTLKDMPSVTLTRKKGKWLKSNIGGAKVCSICQTHMGLSNFKFCPNCGSLMSKEV